MTAGKSAERAGRGRLVFLPMRRATGLVSAVLTTLAVASASVGCSASGASSTAASATSGEAAGQAVIHESALTSALDLIPDMRNGNVMYTDWSMLGHQDPNHQETASFAGGFLDVDNVLQRDLGIRSTDAQWELDVDPPSGAPLFVLGFGSRADLSGLAGKLTRLGFHADGPIFIGPHDPAGLMADHIFNIGIDPGRHLLAESADMTAIRSVLTAPAHPLGDDSKITPLLTLAPARLGRIATASIAVGPAACVQPARLLGLHATRAQLAAFRKLFHGTFTPPQAEITALAGLADTTALDALTFPDQRTAQANRAGRADAAKVAGAPVLGDSAGITVTGASVTGRVLSFDMTAMEPHAFPELVVGSGLGVDLCP